MPHGVVAIDNFEQFHSTSSQPMTQRQHGKNKFGNYYQYYFLSHCHTDHYKGLHDAFFQNAAVSNQTCIICHPITKTLLLSQFPKLDTERILTIDLHQPTLLTYKHNESSRSFTVTLLSSNHCPGSVMFLFDIPMKDQSHEIERILYTGDFRDPTIETIQFLKEVKLTKIYLDVSSRC